MACFVSCLILDSFDAQLELTAEKKAGETVLPTLDTPDTGSREKDCPAEEDR